MKITVNVTQEHIAKGKFGSLTSCPIALALKDYGLDSPRATWDILSWYDNDGEEVLLETPHVAQTFIEDFDAEETVIPFSFEFDYGEARIR